MQLRHRFRRLQTGSVIILPSRVLVIDPGSESTKLVVFDNGTKVTETTVLHDRNELSKCPTTSDQLPVRLRAIRQQLASWQSLAPYAAVVARGGLLGPIAAGTYKVNERMIQDLVQSRRVEHPSNLGALLARELAEDFRVEAYVVDPLSVDEMEPVARITGLPELKRQSVLDALSVRAAARQACAELGIAFEHANFVVASLGSSSSICAIKHGKIVDVNNADEEGPFSTERAGGLPTGEIIRLCFCGKSTAQELTNMITSEGGMYAYTGTKDVGEVLGKISSGDAHARLVLEAMVYQIAKEIGAMAAALSGEVDAVIVTGRLARYEDVVDMLRERVSYVGRFLVYPDNCEMVALAEAVQRVLKGQEQLREY